MKKLSIIVLIAIAFISLSVYAYSKSSTVIKYETVVQTIPVVDESSVFTEMQTAVKKANSKGYRLTTSSVLQLSGGKTRNTYREVICLTFEKEL